MARSLFPLRNYIRDRPPEQDDDRIVRAIPLGADGLIALFRLVASKRRLQSLNRGKIAAEQIDLYR